MIDARRIASLEQKYAGKQKRVWRRVVSQRDPRLADFPAVHDIPGRMMSGVRFELYPYYADIYADRLGGMEDRKFVLVELGVLLGVGLAVWADVFPKARLIGLDIDPGLFQSSRLTKRGAFRNGLPEVYGFDELSDVAGDWLREILRGERIDVMIDDALHDDESILQALAKFLPLMADKFFYFIEDNATVGAKVASLHPGLNVFCKGKMTVISNP